MTMRTLNHKALSARIYPWQAIRLLPQLLFLIFIFTGVCLSAGQAGAPDPDAPDSATPDTSVFPSLRATASRYEMILIGDGTAGPYRLGHRNLFAHSVEISMDGRLLDPGREFTVDCRAGLISFADAIPSSKPLTVRYRFYPYALQDVYSHRSLPGVATAEHRSSPGVMTREGGAYAAETAGGGGSQPLYGGGSTGSPRLENEHGTGHSRGTGGSASEAGNRARSAGTPGSFLILGGSKTLAVTLGSNRQPSLDQSLELSIEGMISNDLSVRAVLADKSSPLQPEGTTRELDQLERIFVEIEGGGARGTLGDYDLALGESAFGSIERRLQGVMGEGRFSRGRVLVAGAVPRGEFATLELVGVDGKQGPYDLCPAGSGGDFVILAGSERVWLDGEDLVRGEGNDYTIDYAARTISFTSRRLITSESRIEVDFQYSGERYEKNLYVSRAVVTAPDESFRLGGTCFWEGDDVDRPRSEGVASFDRSALSRAGDDPRQAWVDTAVEVGEGNGDYLFDVDHFVYVGPHEGDYQVSFFDVGEEGGAYEYDPLIGGYSYVGEGQGRFAPRRLLSLPEERWLLGVDGGMALADGVSVDVEYAQSREDRNRVSSRDDGDNAGDAYAAALRVEDRRAGFGGHDLGHFDLDASYRSVASRFRFPGRRRDVDYAYRWNIDKDAGHYDERAGEVSLAYTPIDALTMDVGIGRLTRPGDASSRRMAFGAALSPGGAPELRYGYEHVARHQSGSQNGDGPSFLERWRHEYAVEYRRGIATPRFQYAREGRRASIPSGRDVREWGAGLTLGQGEPLELSVDHQDRRDWVFGESGESRHLESTGTIDKIHLAAREAGSFTGHIDLSRHRRARMTGGSARISKTDLADVRLACRPRSLGASFDARYGIGAEDAPLAGERYVKVEEGTGSYGFDPETGLYYPYERGDYERDVDSSGESVMARRVFLLADASYAPSEMFAVDSRVSVEELSQEPDLLSLYLLRPHVLQQNDVTIEGRNVWRHDISLFPIPHLLSIRFRYREANREDNRIGGRHREELSRDRSLRVRLTPAPGLWFEGEAAVNDERRASLEHGLERQEHDRAASLSIRHTPSAGLDLTITLGMGTKWVEEPAFYGYLGKIDVSRISLKPRVIYHLVRHARLSGGIQLVERTTDAVVPLLPPDLQASDPLGVSSSWDMLAEYRVSGSVISSLSYSGERRPGTAVSHNLSAEVRAYF